MPEPPPSRQDLQASVAARRELGPDYEDAVLDGFLERLNSSVAAQVDARVEDARRASERQGAQASQRRDSGLVLGIVSLGTGIPITAISAGVAHTPGLVVAWLGIAAVNAAHALGRRRD